MLKLSFVRRMADLIFTSKGTDNKKFYKNPKIMMPIITGEAALLTGKVHLAL